MRILFINQYYWPEQAATAQMLSDLAEYLVCQGHKVTIVASARPYSGEKTSRPSRETKLGVDIRRCRSFCAGRKAGFLGRFIEAMSFYASATVKCLLLPRADVVVTLTSPPLIGILGWFLSMIKGTKHVHWSMDVFPDFLVANDVIKEGGIIHRLLARLAGCYLRTADAIVVLGPYMKERILTYNPRADRVHILPVWADGSKIFPVPRNENWFARKYEINGNFVVLYSGNMTMWESFDTVVAAAEKLQGDKDTVFLIIAQGAPCERLKSVVTAKGLTNFRFLPYQKKEDLAYSLSAANVHLVLIGKEAGMRVPSKIYGIMGVGRAVILIGNEDNEIADIVSKHNIGFIIREGDVNGFVAAIRSLRADPQLLHDISRRARAEFEKKYDVAVVVDQFEQLLIKVDKECSS